MAGACAASSASRARTPTLSLDNMDTPGGVGDATLTLGVAHAADADGDYIFSLSIVDSGGTTEQFWLTNGAPPNYEARVTVNSGSLTSGTVGAWTRADTALSWVGTGVNLTLEVGAYGTSTALDSCTVTL